MNYDAIDREYPADALKIVHSLLPAHSRYFDFVGVVKEHRDTSVIVRVYGLAPQPCYGIALMRRGGRAPKRRAA